MKSKRLSRWLLIPVAALLLLTGKPASAQFFTGGDLNVSFLGGLNVDIAPIIGYRVKNFSAGLSPVLMYTASGNTTGNFSYGGRIFGEYSIYKGVFAHVEFGALNTGYIDWPADGSAGILKRNWVMSAPVGVGYEKMISSGVWFRTMVLYDVLLDINLNQSSPLANPQVRVGFSYMFN